MTRISRALAASMTLPVLLTGLLTGCSDDAAPVAQDSAATDDPSPAAPPESTPTVTSTPKPPREAGSYPVFEPGDYTYTLAVGCFCADAGAPITITVVDGEVTDAVYSGPGRGAQPGADAPNFRELTINDVIDAANDPDVATVDVTWPDDQEYPSEVYIDRIKRAIDDEVTYTVSDVVVD